MKTRRSWIPIALTAAGIFLISQYGEVPKVLPWLSTDVKQMGGHLILFFCLGFLTARYLWGMGLGVLPTAVLTLDLCALFGIYDEFHQFWVDGRGVELLDLKLDVVGGLLGCLIYLAWGLICNLVKRPRVPREQLLRALVVHAALALTVFVFVLIPAAVYWKPLTAYVDVLSSDASFLAERVVRKHAPEAHSGTSTAGSPREARLHLPTDTGLAGPRDTPIEADPGLLEFVQFVNLLAEKPKRSGQKSGTPRYLRHLQGK